MKRFLIELKRCRYSILNAQQYRTLKGQALSGDIEGAYRGLQKIINRAIMEGAGMNDSEGNQRAAQG